jgi:TolA-binding protein
MEDTKRALFLFGLLSMIIVLSSFSPSIASTSLSSYEATFEVIANPEGEFRDVQVALKITYQIPGGSKKEGKKFVEAPSIEAVQVTDGEGTPLRFQVTRIGKRYSKISWYFRDVNEVKRVVIVRFTLPDAITIKEDTNYFWAYWVGSWVVPVEKAVYRFIFPAGYAYRECSVYPKYKYEEKIAEGKKSVEVSIVPLKDESFTLAFSPGFVRQEEVGKAAKGSEAVDKAAHKPEKNNASRLERVRFGTHGAFSRIVMDLKEETSYVVATPEENVITVSISNCTLNPRVQGEKYHDKLVRALAFEEKPGKEVVARIDLTELKGSFKHAILKDPPRLVFDVAPKKDADKNEKEFLKEEGAKGKKTDAAKKELVQAAPSASEEEIKKDRIEEDKEKENATVKLNEAKIKEEEIKEDKGGKERVLVKAEEIKSEQKAPLKSSSTTTIDLGPQKTEENQGLREEAQRAYSSARELFQREKYIESLTMLRYFMDNYPRNELADDVSFLIGDCYFYLAEESILSSYQPALDAFQLALALYAGSENAPRGYYQLANAYREMGYYFEADENYKFLMETYPNVRYIPATHFWIAENLFQGEEFEEARDRFQNYIVKYPQGEYLRHASFRMADCLVGLKKYKKALRRYEEGLDRWPAYSKLLPETLYSMGLTYMKSGNSGKARSVLFMSLNVFPDQEYNHIILTKIGDSYRVEGKVEEALKVYSQNSALYPESKGALISEIKMADIGVKNPGFFKFDQYLEPLEVYQRIIEKYPITDLAEEALYKQGFAYAKQKRHQKAILSLETVLDEYPDSELSKRCFYSLQENLSMLINSYFSEEKYYPILDLHKKYETPFLVDIKDSKTFFQIGESFRQIGLYAKAFGMYEKARRIYPPTHPEDELILRTGETCLLKKEYYKAENLFKKMINNFPASNYRRIALHNLADTYFEQESYEKARLAYLSVLGGTRRIPRDLKGFFCLGKSYQAIGNVSLTIDAYRQVIQVAEGLGKEWLEDEYVIKSYFQLADYLYQIRRYVDAIKVYTQAIERYPEDERTQWALYRIAAGYRKVGKEGVEIESLKNLASKGSRGAFWEKVISENIRNLEWEASNSEHLAP